jgi:hypothetical protein
LVHPSRRACTSHDTRRDLQAYHRLVERRPLARVLDVRQRLRQPLLRTLLRCLGARDVDVFGALRQLDRTSGV